MCVAPPRTTKTPSPGKWNDNREAHRADCVRIVHVIDNAIIVVRVASAHLLQARRGCGSMMSLSDTPQTFNLLYRRPS